MGTTGQTSGWMAIHLIWLQMKQWFFWMTFLNYFSEWLLTLLLRFAISCIIFAATERFEQLQLLEVVSILSQNWLDLCLISWNTATYDTSNCINTMIHDKKLVNLLSHISIDWVLVMITTSSKPRALWVHLQH